MSYTGERSSLRSDEKVPASYVDNGGELSLSSLKLIAIINGVLEKGASFRFCASGGSMYPFIRENDILTLTPISGPLSVGDVIAFVHPGSGCLAVHRIIGKNKVAYILKGDNLEISDGLVPIANILGKVSKVERRKRSVRAGLGLEKSVIALGSRTNLLRRINTFARIIYAIIDRVSHVA